MGQRKRRIYLGGLAAILAVCFVAVARGVPQRWLERLFELDRLKESYISVIGRTQEYSYERCKADMEELQKRWPELVRVESIGTTAFGRDIMMLTLGNPDSPNRIWVDGGIHGREYMGAQVILSQVEFILQNEKDGRFRGWEVSALLENCGVYIVPMLNPDGVMLSQQGVFSAPEAFREELAAMNGGSQNFSRWKANGRGVDLGCNFDARWEFIEGKPAPGPMGYKGTAPFSEAESRAVQDYLADRPMGITLSYHGAGAEVYWWYYQKGERLVRDERLARELSRITGYDLVSEERSRESNGGLKDWYLSTYGNPGSTIEMRSPEPCPIPIQAFLEVYEENKRVILWAMAWIAK